MNDFRWLLALDSLGYDGARMLLSLLWQSSIVFLAGGGLGFLLRKRSPAIRHAVWTAAILSLPILTVVALFPRSAPLPVSPIPVFPNYALVSPELSLARQAPPVATVDTVSRSTESEGNSPFRYPWMSAAVLYLAGITILLVPIFLGRLRVRRWIDDGAPVLDERVIDIGEELSARFGLRRTVMMVESEHTAVPFTVRFFHPVIVLPDGFSKTLSGPELRVVLAHEIAHVRRGDSLIGTVAVCIRAFFFFHPGVWWAGREIAALAENACDDLALEVAETPVSYARLVTRIAENAVTRPTPMEYASGMIFSRKAFLRRVEIILSHRKETIMKLSLPALSGVILIGGLSLVTAFALPLGETGKGAKPAGSLGVSGSKSQSVQVAQAAKPSQDQIVRAAPGILAGTVTDEAGKPLEGVRVDVWSWSPGNETHTDSQGKFRLEGLNTDKKVEILFSKKGFSPRQYFEVTTGISNLPVRLGNRTYFEGQVTSPEGKPVSGALIRADRGMKTLGDGSIVSHLWTETESDSDGRYRLYVDVDTYEIQVTVPNVGVARLQKQGIGFDESRHLDIPLQKGVTFHARIVDSLTGKPVQGARLFHWQFSGIEGISNEEGQLEIRDMMPGPFSFYIEVKGYSRWWSDEAIGMMQRLEPQKATRFQRNFDFLTFDLQPGMKEVTITMDPSVKITGRVVDPDGKPVAGATVAPTLTGDGNSLTGDTRFSVETNADGTFEMFLPASGDVQYNIMAHDGKFQEWRTWANGILDPIKTRPGQVISGVTIALTRPATVSGTAVDKKGNPIANYVVHATAAERTENRYYHPTATTDAQGNFTIRFVRPGKNLIQASQYVFPKGQEPEGTSVEVTLREGETKKGIKLIGFKDINELNAAR